MKQISFILLVGMCALIYTGSIAQISITGASHTTPALSSSYSSLAGAITGLNAISAISGPVTISLSTGHKETAPAGGYTISFTAATTATNSITLDGSPSYDTITANASLTAGSLTDAIFKIIGSDYVTIKRFTMRENAANTTTTAASNNMTEWGVALLRASGTNGAQHNSILDNTIILNRTYPNSFGIYSNVRHPATDVNPAVATDISNSTTAPNHGNIFQSNRISQVSLGIAVVGSNTDARMDTGNDIGGTSSVTGNSITEWGSNSLPTATFLGNMSNQYYGILSRCQKADNISWNTVTSSTSLSGSVAAPVRGIQKAGSTTMTGTITSTIDHNTISVTDNLPSGTTSVSRLEGIYVSDKLGSATLYIRENVIDGLHITGTASSRNMRCIATAAGAGSMYINGNTIKGCTTTASAMGGWFYGIDSYRGCSK